MNYYNELDPFAADWLESLIRAGLIPPGKVDRRSITEVEPNDLDGFTQCHFFAGIGGWSEALRIAGVGADVPVWTGSCPCQKFSSATRGRSVATDLWPEFRRLIERRKPGVVFGEQVANAGRWFDGVCDDMEALGYACRAAILPAVSVGKDHIRNRIYFACHADTDSQPGCPVNAETSRMPEPGSDAPAMVRANGVSRDVVALSGFGNAIVPQVAAEFIKAFLG